MTETEWLTAVNATDLWAFVRHRMGFNRRILDAQESEHTDAQEPEYNQRVLYLTGVAVCGRLAHLFPDKCCHRMLQVPEAYAEGTATLDELCDAHDEVAGIRNDANRLSAAKCAAVEAAFWLCQDDYKVIPRWTTCPMPPAICERSLMESCRPTPTFMLGELSGSMPVFLAAKREEEQRLCDLIRDAMGNPFRPSPPLPPATFAWNDGAIRKMAQAIYDTRAFDRLPLLADALEDAGCTDADILGHSRGGGEHVPRLLGRGSPPGKGVDPFGSLPSRARQWGRE